MKTYKFEPAVIQSLTDSDFESHVHQSKGVVLVDFWAPWCSACRHLSPLLERLAETFPTGLKIYKIDVDQDAQFAQEYEVRGLPTVLLFRNGELMGRFHGVYPFSRYEEMIRQYLIPISPTETEKKDELL